jgi:hypothetical protein
LDVAVEWLQVDAGVEAAQYPLLVGAGVRAQPELVTRSVPVRWAVVVDGALPAGLVTNAVACLGAAVAALVPAVVGEGATDASGTAHPGLPWLGCTILRGDSATVRAVRSKALGDPAVLVGSSWTRISLHCWAFSQSLHQALLHRARPH